MITKQDRPIAYYSGWGMIYIYGIDYGVDYRVIYTIGTSKKAHKRKIYWGDEKDYFICNGHRIPLDECIRM